MEKTLFSEIWLKETRKKAKEGGETRQEREKAEVGRARSDGAEREDSMAVVGSWGGTGPCEPYVLCLVRCLCLCIGALDGDLGAMRGIVLFVLCVVSASKATDHFFEAFLLGLQFGLAFLVGFTKRFATTAKYPGFFVKGLEFFADLRVVFVDIDDASDQTAVKGDLLDFFGHQVAVLCGVSVDKLVLFGECLVNTLEPFVFHAGGRGF